MLINHIGDDFEVLSTSITNEMKFVARLHSDHSANHFYDESYELAPEI